MEIPELNFWSFILESHHYLFDFHILLICHCLLFTVNCTSFLENIVLIVFIQKFWQKNQKYIFTDSFSCANYNLNPVLIFNCSTAPPQLSTQSAAGRLIHHEITVLFKFRPALTPSLAPNDFQLSSSRDEVLCEELEDEMS